LIRSGSRVDRLALLSSLMTVVSEGRIVGFQRFNVQLLIEADDMQRVGRDEVENLGVFRLPFFDGAWELGKLGQGQARFGGYRI
jgi:hypothetical protein